MFIQVGGGEDYVDHDALRETSVVTSEGICWVSRMQTLAVGNRSVCVSAEYTAHSLRGDAERTVEQARCYSNQILSFLGFIKRGDQVILGDVFTK